MCAPNELSLSLSLSPRGEGALRHTRPQKQETASSRPVEKDQEKDAVAENANAGHQDRKALLHAPVSRSHLGFPPQQRSWSPALRRARARTEAPQAFRRGESWEHMGRVGLPLGSIPVVPPPWEVTRVSSYVRRPFPSKETGEHWPGMIPARPLYQGQGIGLGSRNLEKVGR
jgi:hypothetical protein